MRPNFHLLACGIPARTGLVAGLVWLACILGGAPAQAQTTRAWTGAVSSDWFVAGNWNPAGVPAANDIVNITSGTINLTAPVTISNQLNWSGGTLLGNGLTIAGGGALTVNGSGTMNLGNSLTNAGTVNWTDGTITLNNCSYNPGPVINLAGGVWNVQCDKTLNSACSAGTNIYFMNAGTVNKFSGTGTSTFTIPFHNNGAVGAQAGTISFQSGGTIDGTFNAGTGTVIKFGSGNFTAGPAPVISGAGAVQFTGGSLLLAYNMVPNLQLTGGTLSLAAGFEGGSITNLTLDGTTLAGTNTVSGTLNWNSGTIGGALTITSNGVLNLIGNSTMYVSGGLTNGGTVNWIGGSFYLYSCSSTPGPVVNLPGAVWSIQCNQSFTFNCSLLPTMYFLNLGTVQKTAGTGTTYFSIPFNNLGNVTALQGTIDLNNGAALGGAFTAASGATVKFSAGAFSYSTPPVLTGPGAIQFSGGTLTLLDDLIPGLQLTGGTLTLSTNFQGGVITNFTLSGSTLPGDHIIAGTFNLNSGTAAGAFTVENGAVMNWMGGTAGALNIASNGVLNLIGDSAMYLAGALTNAGTVNWIGGNFYLASCNSTSGPVVNLPGAMWFIQCNQSFSYNCSLLPTVYFLNLGTVQKTAGTGTTYFSIPFNNLGNVTALQGTISLNSGAALGGTFTADSGATIKFSAGAFSYSTPPALIGPGAIQFTGGTLTLLDDLIPGLQLTGGTLTLSTNFQGGVITNFTLSGSTLPGDHIVAGVFNLNSGSAPGSFAVLDSAVMNWLSGDVGALNIASNGVLNLIGDSAMYLAGALTNAGTVNWIGGNFYLASCNSTSGPVVNLPGAMWSIQCNQSFSYNCSLLPTVYFLNLGTVQKTAGTGTTYFSIPFNNLGNVTALQGTISLNSGAALGGTFTADSGATIKFSAGAFSYSTPPALIGPGAIQFTGGTLTLLDDLIPGLQLTGGTLTLSTSFQGGVISNLTLNGSTLAGDHIIAGVFNLTSGSAPGSFAVLDSAVMNWLSGDVGVLNISSNGAVNLIGTSTMTLDGALTNAGTVNWTGGNFYLAGCSTYPGPVVNLPSGLWSIQCNQSLSYNCSWTTNMVFQNLGTMRKSAVTGSTYCWIPVYNSGLLDVQSGVINFNGSPAYAQTGATMNFGLAGPSGTAKVNITGNMNFDGTLSINLLNGYSPAIGDSIALAGYGSEAGAFKNLALAPLAAGRAWQLAYGATSLALKVVANSNTVGQITGAVVNNLGQAVTNLIVFAYTTNNYYVSTRTDTGGNYVLGVSNGVFQVGLQGLPARGYNAVTNQIVAVTNTIQVINFTVEPYTGPMYYVTTSVNPPGGGTAVGGGTFPPGTLVTVSATANTNPLPYFFANWTENSVVQSTSTNYTFSAGRDRALVANFTLPVFSVSATNNPPGAGLIIGAGSYFYGATAVLTAQPVFGYSFINWTEDTNIVGTGLTLSTVIYSNRAFTANYSAANLIHVVTTATSPSGLAAVSGAGTYTNGQTANFSAPTALTNVPFVYTFKQYTLSNAVVATNASFNKTFSTLDATNLQYVAVYSTRTLLPLLTNVAANYASPVPATTNFVLTLQFDRSMNTNVPPVVVLTNSGAGLQAVVGSNGSWSKTVLSNDTYRTPPITLSTGMDGTNRVFVSGAQDVMSLTLATTNPVSFVVDATPPPAPTLNLVSSNAAGPAVTVGWAGYTAPADLNGFRVYLQPTNFSSAAAVPIYVGLWAGARSYQFNGLSLDTPYFVAVQAYDAAGNSINSVAPLSFVLPSTIPPAVTLQQTPQGADTALLSWSGYDSSGLFGFAGFRIYSAPTNFSSVAGLTPFATVGAAVRSYQANGLDRTRPCYFAVVGCNATNGFNPNVTTVSWSDPYAGNLGVNTTIGDATSRPSVINIYQNVVVVSNATLTIQAGTTLRFAPGTGLTVQQGSLVANGTALAPIVFDSANDTPAAGDWSGVGLGAGAGFSVLRFVEIRYGGGLTVSGCSPTVDAFTAAYNTPWGLGLQNGATLTTSNAFLTANTAGAVQFDTAALTLSNSAVRNNTTNAIAAGSLPLNAPSVWWGTTVSTNLTAKLDGAVNYAPFLMYEPLLTPAVGTSNGVTQVGAAAVDLHFACRTAEAMRVSEDYNFTGVFFSPFTNYATFNLSPGGGLKRIYAQYRSATGQTNTPLELDVNYVTGGPVIQSFSLAQSQTLSRPLQVTGSATAVLGMLDVEFYVDGVLWGTNSGGSLSQYFDVRSLNNAAHEVEILARDKSGNITTLKNQVVIALTPPPAPVITQPVAGLTLNTNLIAITGTAEPGIGLQLTRNGRVLVLTNADASGHFTLTNALLDEGDNLLLAIAADSTGTTPSAARHVNVETIPPAQLVMNQPVYTPGSGLGLSWSLPSTGKPAISFQVFWSQTPFATTNQATGHSIVLSKMYYTVQGIPDGTYYFGVVGFDSAGNPSPLSTLVSSVFDATPPSLAISYSPTPPIGVTPLTIVLTASEPLASTPSLTLQAAGAYSPILLSLTNVALNTWQSAFNVTATTASGAVAVRASAQDLAGNVFNGVPAGPQLVFDTTPPAGSITTVPASPVQTTNSTNVVVNLALTESAQPGTPPSLTFTPPQGSSVSITLGGAGSNWSGALPLTPAMGSGFGQFTLSVLDAVGNPGTNILSGKSLELYNTALPAPPAGPQGLAASSLAGGQIKLSWNVSSNAQIYRLYREPGTNLIAPAVLVADNITSNTFLDLPAADGSYRYGATASRLGSESGLSNVVVAMSDRTPPPAPINVAAGLASSGVQITWQEPPGEVPNHYRIYRNGVAIATAATVTPVVDYPPKGTNNYVVTAADAVGNESLSAPAVLELLVGPVNNLAAVCTANQPVLLSWTSTDPQATGFNLYRNGIKQNASPLTTNSYADPLPLADVTQYAVTAVNGSGQESPSRLVSVYPVGLNLLANADANGASRPLLSDYFDLYQAGITNLAATSSLPLAQVQLTRTIPGLAPLVITRSVVSNLVAGAALQQLFVAAEPSILATQTVQVAVSQQTDSQGSRVTYLQSFTFLPDPLRSTEINISANQLPLAGGLNSFQVQVRNPSYVDIQFIVSRNSGATAGDFYISVLNGLGQEVSRTAFQGTPPGTFFLPDGRAYVTVKAGATLNFTVPNVLVPAALSGDTNVTFMAVAGTIYYQLNAPDQVASGPISGSMVSSGLAQPPYYGTADTDQPVYANNDPILITGQALNTATGLPVPGASLNIGFAARGHKWYAPVTTDANGNYQYTYHPPPGFGGVLTIWAAHPLVVDQLNQAGVIVSRVYCSPAGLNITMSKNDSIDFSMQLINPGDLPLTGISCSFNAYQMSGTNRIPVSSVTGTNVDGELTVDPNQKKTVGLRLSAGIDAPDRLVVEFTFTSVQGATVTFLGNVTLLPAVPVLTVVKPSASYLEVSVNRGEQRSGQITVQNTGLRDLQGVTLMPPTNNLWMQVNLPIGSDGLVHLPDLAVGQSNTFMVVFSPPPDTPLAFYQDAITIRGTNSATAFEARVYALVTSSRFGAVQFFVDDILGQPVPNATVRLHSNVLLTEPPPVRTDTNGLVTITNLQEGTWDWQVTAAGCSSTMGTVEIIPDQTQYQHTRLSRSLVTITFNVVPVPFTDKYEIKVEQTFETHVPAPVIVLDPPYVSFKEVTPGFEANFLVNVKNYGLIQLSDVTITGQQSGGLQLTPLITYIPVLLPMQSVDVPFSLTYDTPNSNSGPMSRQMDGDDLVNCATGMAPFGGFFDPSVAKGIAALCKGTALCDRDLTPQQAGALLAATVGLGLLANVATSAGEAVATALGNLIGCIFGNLLGAGAGGGGLEGGPQGPVSFSSAQAGNGCFPPDTLVLMADGAQKPIASLQRGDVVRTGPNAANIAAVSQVSRTFSASQQIIEFTGARFRGPRRLAATPEHQLWVDGKGWTSAANVAVGDWLTDQSGARLVVTRNEKVAVAAEVFTLNLSRDSAFYANGVLVHDACGKTPPPFTSQTREAAK